MEGFTEAVRTVCFVSVGICLIGKIGGATKLKAQLEFIFKLILAVVIVSSFFSENIEFDLSDIRRNCISERADYKALYERELAESTGKNISDVLMSQLRAAGVKAEKIRTEVNISKDGSISINKVIVETDETEAAANIIRNSLGQETEVVNEKV